MLLLVLLEALFERQFSWLKFTFFLSSIFHFWFFLVDFYMVLCLSFASLPRRSFGPLCPSPIFFFRFHLAMPHGIMGGRRLSHSYDNDGHCVCWQHLSQANQPYLRSWALNA